MAVYIPLIYWLVFMAWAMLLVAYYMKDFAITFLVGLFMMILGIWITSHGLDASQTLLSTGFGLIHIGIGGYLTIRSTIDLINKYI